MDRPAAGSPVLRAQGLSKMFPPTSSGGRGVPLFRDLHFDLLPGESVAVVGRSGTGKSSLLHLLAGLERPTSGQVWLGSDQITSLDAKASAQVRNRHFGFVWQFHYLLPEFSAWENIALPLLARGIGRSEARLAALDWLGRVDLASRAEHRSGELSGGEQQRVAIARALVTAPRVLLADEPTGDLDDVTADQLFRLLQTLCRQSGLAVVIVTHNLELARRCDRVLRLQNGCLEPA